MKAEESRSPWDFSLFKPSFQVMSFLHSFNFLLLFNRAYVCFSAAFFTLRDINIASVNLQVEPEQRLAFLSTPDLISFLHIVAFFSVFAVIFAFLHFLFGLFSQSSAVELKYLEQLVIS